MTPLLWESPIYTNICMNLAMFLSCQASLAEKMAWLGQKQTKQAWQLKIAKFMQILVAPKADWTQAFRADHPDT